jgi:hypothetical protein
LRTPIWGQRAPRRTERRSVGEGRNAWETAFRQPLWAGGLKIGIRPPPLAAAALTMAYYDQRHHVASRALLPTNRANKFTPLVTRHTALLAERPAVVRSSRCKASFPRGSACPTLKCIRERADFLITEQPSNLRYRQAVVSQILRGQVASQVVQDFRERYLF